MSGFHVINNTPVTKRLPESRLTGENITSYGSDNLYPQRMKEVALLSPITKSAISLIATFIRGDGFTNNPVVNEAGETANDILRLIAEDQALYNGYGLHLNSSGLGNVSEVQHVPFEFIRLGLANQKGIIRDVKVSNNWEQSNADILPDPALSKPVTYRIYNQASAANEAITTARGMVLYAVPKKNHYPLASLDAIIETAHSDHELQCFELGNISNGFLSMSIFKYPSGGDTEVEEKELVEKLNAFKGSRNANSILVAPIDEDWEGSGNLVEQIPANNNDTLFQNTTLNVKNRILQNYALPAGLMGMLPEGAVFTATQLADEFTYMNLRVKDIRKMISAQFEKLGLNVGEIQPNQFESSQMLENNGTITG